MSQTRLSNFYLGLCIYPHLRMYIENDFLSFFAQLGERPGIQASVAYKNGALLTRTPNSRAEPRQLGWKQKLFSFINRPTIGVSLISEDAVLIERTATCAFTRVTSARRGSSDTRNPYQGG